jgi:hypothetical protein
MRELDERAGNGEEDEGDDDPNHEELLHAHTTSQCRRSSSGVPFPGNLR